MFFCSASLIFGQENTEKKQDKANVSSTKITKTKKTRVAVEEEVEVAPKFLLKTKPYATFSGIFLKLNYEQAITANGSLEIEGGIGNPLLILNDSYFEEDSYNLTVRYKKYRNRSLKEEIKDKGNNLMKGFYTAPVITLGNKIQYDFTKENPSYSNYYVAAMMDGGYQFFIKNFVVDVFAGAGLSFNTSDDNVIYNVTHTRINSLALRFGIRTGIKFE